MYIDFYIFLLFNKLLEVNYFPLFNRKQVFYIFLEVKSQIIILNIVK